MTNIRRYIGPCDTLGRVICGDIITYDQFINDMSPWINTFINAAIVARLAYMVR